MSDSSFGLILQRLDTSEAVLLASLACTRRSERRWFSTADVADLFRALHVPQPTSNLSRDMGCLRDRDYLLRADGAWSLTPVGEQEAERALDEFDLCKLEAELAQVPSADFASARHPLVPPEFAPSRWSSAIGRLHQRYPFDQSVFLMTRFPASTDDGDFSDPVGDVIPVLRRAVAEHGLYLHTAADRQLDDELWGNVGGYIWACRYGIGLLETRGEYSDQLNDNALIEVGSMLITGRRCAILKDVTAPEPPTDLTAHIWKDVDLDDHDSVATAVHRWLSSDLGLEACSRCPQDPAVV